MDSTSKGFQNLFTYYVVHVCVTSCILWHSSSHITHSLEIHNLSIGKSEFELKENEGIGISISNVSAVFKGTINYGYGSWLWVFLCITTYQGEVSVIPQLWFNPCSTYVFNDYMIFCSYSMNFKVPYGQPVNKSHAYISVTASQFFFVKKMNISINKY